ncbi:hypothetical protein [Speluncibacter jeojiensis]|uniref:Transmembrane protein n=1 Tax=Speluncibacter jeojiensis TaxID=2710754 RepID=A0A9X4M0L0_9ACTN|nr:hypothetical protein [Corynebacteriales bacterium D3-21]
MSVRTGVRRLAVPAYSLALTLLILGPLLGPGYLLVRDAVSTPRSYLNDSALGLSDAAPRAVPQDTIVAAMSTVIDGGVLVKLILGLALWSAGVGAAAMAGRLLPGLRLGPRLVAATVAVWNPYVAERLLQGHWSLLVGYAALPWVVCAGLRLRRPARGPRDWAALAVPMACAGLTPTGAVLAAITAVVVMAVPGGGARARRVLGAVALFVVVSAPWLLAAALGGADTSGSDPTGVAAFAARAEFGLGTLGSLAGLGGIWNRLAVPGSRTGLFTPIATLVLVGLVAAGLPQLWRRRRNPTVVAVVAMAAAAVVLPALGATGAGLDVGRWAVAHVPGAGLARDAQKWVALAMPGYSVAAAAGVAWVQRRLAGRVLGPAAPVLACAALIAFLPDLAWGVHGALRPVHYPSSWRSVEAITATDRSGDVAVLPTGTFRMFPWSGPVAVLDPAPRMLRPDVLQVGSLVVDGTAVGGEGHRAQAVQQALLDGAEPARLAESGVRWVLVERGSLGEFGASTRTLERLERVYADDGLALYRVPGPVVAYPTATGARAVMIGAHLLWAAVLAGGLLVCVVPDLVKYVARRRTVGGRAGRSRDAV